MGRVYRIPKSVYYQCMWIVKDIERLRRLEALSNYGQDKNEAVFFVDEEEMVADEKVFEEAKWKLQCIRDAINAIPEEYRQMTMDSIIFSIPFNDMAHENTWKKWRHNFIRELAKNLYLI